MSLDFLDLADVLELHRVALATNGGLDGGVNRGLIESALSAPENRHLYELSQSVEKRCIALLASTYWYHLVLNHGFSDGNKRVGLSATELFLNKNGYELSSSSEEVESMTLRIASSEASREDVDEFVLLAIRSIP